MVEELLCPLLELGLERLGVVRSIGATNQKGVPGLAAAQQKMCIPASPKIGSEDGTS